ncbi:Gfo/Idh/MocA family protein [Paenibacillus methanolicus]|uniref:Putative dehydrogenase n=1 Tax=Paenibacillus methanolicus TaxID=582686 RepID=A0A5S5CD51_9BACL|nr:Gfo/Idh/MocA family oxidoreductase [Paenibacillus methanolicus]TYP76568.1 putative dehydrogenase [Paenibacillus methanolicus]
MMSQILNVGLVGVGEVAQVIHLPVLEAMPDRYRIAAMCDVSPKLLAAMGNKYGVDRLYMDAGELANDPEVDVVFVLNSNEYHAECAIAAANAGKHVLIEKPMCLTFAEADAIIEAKNRSGVKVMVGYMRRYAASFVEAVEQIRGIERIHYARVRDIIGPNGFFIKPTSHTVAFGDIPEALKEDRNRRTVALVSEATGLPAGSPLHDVYGLLGGLSSHDLSVMREALGMPQGVVGAKYTETDGWPFLTVIFDYGSFSVVFETGVDLQGRFDAHIEVYGMGKSVKVQYDTPYIRHLPTKLIVGETDGEVYTESVVRPTFTDPYTLELKHLHEAITQDREPKTTAEDYKDDLVLFKMIVDALASAEKGS